MCHLPCLNRIVASLFCGTPHTGHKEVTGNGAAEGKTLQVLARVGPVLDERLSALLDCRDSQHVARYKQGLTRWLETGFDCCGSCCRGCYDVAWTRQRPDSQVVGLRVT